MIASATTRRDRPIPAGIPHDEWADRIGELADTLDEDIAEHRRAMGDVLTAPGAVQSLPVVMRGQGRRHVETADLDRSGRNLAGMLVAVAVITAVAIVLAARLGGAS